MKSSKRIFFILTGIFLFIIILIGLDIAQRTTPPWAKENIKHDNENIEINRE